MAKQPPWSPYPTMNTIVCNQDTYFLGPIKEPVLGWRIRPGTFRVAVPYDRSSQPPTGLSDEECHPHSGQRKKRKLPQKETSLLSGNEEKLAQWISSQLRATLNQSQAMQFIRDMRSDDFYRAGSLESMDSLLDFVQLQPTLQMLKSGFSDTSSKSEGGFDELQLCEVAQNLDIGDIYETLVENSRPSATIINVLAENTPKYLVPPRSAFIISDLEKIHGLTSIAQQRGGFDIIIMDPPWQNASVDRLSRYKTLDLYDLFKIPIPDLLRKDGEVNTRTPPVIAVWITNRSKVNRFVVEKLFPAWGLKLVAHWYWLKITTNGEPVLDLNNTHRKAYEGILIGRRIHSSYSLREESDVHSSIESELPDALLGNILPETNKRLLVSVPSQHSRKPALGALLRREFFDDADHTGNQLNQLELFARSLEEGVISWGNEPLHYQYCGRDTKAGPVFDGYLHPT